MKDQVFKIKLESVGNYCKTEIDKFRITNKKCKDFKLQFFNLKVTKTLFLSIKTEQHYLVNNYKDKMLYQQIKNSKFKTSDKSNTNLINKLKSKLNGKVKIKG